MVRHSLVIMPIVICIAFFTLNCSPSSAGPNIEAGKWEITSKIEVPGMPENMPQNTFTQTQCLTKDDYVPRGSKNQSGQDCRIEDVQTSGNTVTWTMHCNSAQGQMDGEGEITYHGDTFEGTIKMMTQGGEMIQHMNGRRIGDCD